jgi:hypothetical protein
LPDGNENPAVLKKFSKQKERPWEAFIVEKYF